MSLKESSSEHLEEPSRSIWQNRMQKSWWKFGRIVIGAFGRIVIGAFGRIVIGAFGRTKCKSHGGNLEELSSEHLEEP